MVDDNNTIQNPSVEAHWYDPEEPTEILDNNEDYHRDDMKYQAEHENATPNIYVAHVVEIQRFRSLFKGPMPQGVCPTTWEVMRTIISDETDLVSRPSSR